MQILNQLETAPIPFAEEEKRHSRRLVVGVLCAVVLTSAVLGGYLYLRKRHERQVAAAQVVETRKATQVEVFVDEAMVNGKTTLLGGTIHNISNEPLHHIAVELQLRRRTGGGIETRSVTPETTEIPPDGKARYSLELPVQNYISATFFRVFAEDNHAEVAFRVLPGAARPPMAAPAPKTVIVSRPASRGNGEEFINTPNNPGRVP